VPKIRKILVFAIIIILILSTGFFIGFLSYPPIQRIRSRILSAQRQRTEETRLTGGYMNKEAPRIVSETLDGEKWSLAEQNGKVVVVFFWSILCGNCVEKIPMLNGLYSRYGSREDFLLVGVHRFPDREIIACYSSIKGITWPQLYEGGEPGKSGFSSLMGIKRTPSIVIIDKKGIVRAINADFEKLEGEVQELLESKSGN